MRGTGDGPIALGKTQRRWLAVIAGRHPGTRDIWPQGQIRLLGGKTLATDLKQMHQIKYLLLYIYHAQALHNLCTDFPENFHIKG